MGISNFMGERAKPKKGIDAAIAVSDYMTKKLISFTPQQTLLETMETLVRNEITGGPVVNDKGVLIGMISESDCMKQLSDSRYFNMPMSTEIVEKYMSTIVETIDSSASIFEAAEQFHKSPYKRFPVLEGSKLVGQISQHDIILAALHLNSQNWGH
ncbi:CBS domain-containing protein [Aquimarina agarilytica]|uniref:CBS domain-containing protein n=1 Tax=Aquimarina agarilytica TaxID=1087449 RepID=UPI00028A037A|nr:CBS domain-containing protein [Aquimarina agarilytica]